MSRHAARIVEAPEGDRDGLFEKSQMALGDALARLSGPVRATSGKFGVCGKGCGK